jgi:hypothetical protein
MGWCHEFGPEIRSGCNHPMVAGSGECHCDACGAYCEGRFKGCQAVWARGGTPPVVISPPAPSSIERPPVDATPADAGPSTPEVPSEPTPVPVSGLAPAHELPPSASAPGVAGPRLSPRDDDLLRAVCSALETVGAELRAMRTVVDGNGRHGGSQTEPVLDRLAELLDRFPARMQAAVREAVAEVSPNGRRNPPPSGV